MQRMVTTKLSFHRLDLSPYQAEDFPEREKLSLNEIGISYSDNPAQADILISNTHTDFSSLNDSVLKKTQLLIHPNSGYDNIPCSFVTNAEFPVVSGNSIRANGVTEYILGRLFHHFSQINHQPEWQAGRQWNRRRLADQNILIIGHGIIGALLEQAISSLVKNLHIYDPFKSKLELITKDIDVVLVAASLNKTSEGLIDKDLLKDLNSGWTLINGARGKIVAQSELLEALKKDKQAYAYLDVFEKEPFIPSEFSNIPNLMCSSHVAGVSKNLDDLILDFEVKVLKDFVTHRSNSKKFESIYSNLLLSNKVSPDKSFLI